MPLSACRIPDYAVKLPRSLCVCARENDISCFRIIKRRVRAVAPIRYIIKAGRIYSLQIYLNRYQGQIEAQKLIV